MYTSAELQGLRNVNPTAVIPGIDTPAGNPIATTALKSISVLPTTNNSLGIVYDAVNNRVIISKAGTVLSGYDFGTATVDINASNVTIQDCSFEATSGNYAVQIAGGYANATVTNCTFNGEGASLPLAAWIASSTTPVTVTNNQFLNTPADGLHCFGGSIIRGIIFPAQATPQTDSTRMQSGSRTAPIRCWSPTISLIGPPTPTRFPAPTTASASRPNKAASATSP